MSHSPITVQPWYNLESRLLQIRSYNSCDTNICSIFIYTTLLIILFFNRSRLRLKHVHITFLPCFAHQMNLFVGEIFKESDKFKQASVKAIKISLYFKSSNNKYFIGQLLTLQKKTYEKYVQTA